MHYRVWLEATKDDKQKPGEPVGFEAWKDVALPIRPQVGDRLCCCCYFSGTVGNVCILVESQTVNVNTKTRVVSPAIYDKARDELKRQGWNLSERFIEGTRP